MPLSHKVDTEEVKVCVIGSGVGSKRISLSSTTSPTQQAFGVSLEVEADTPSGEVWTLLHIS